MGILTKLGRNINRALVSFSPLTQTPKLSSVRMTTAQPSPKVRLSERLSQLVRPVNYNLRLDPNLELGTYRGSVDILVDVKEHKEFLNLHTKYLDINDVKLFSGKDEVPISKYTEVKHLEQLVIYLEKPIGSGTYHIVIEFGGSLTNQSVGFYSSHFNDRVMAASKFQPTYARQAFPCFDEPEFKATFDTTLTKPVNYIALSNMNEINSSHDNETNKDIVQFATSVPMSTYLACFVVCDFEHKETEIDSHGIGDNFTLRAFAQKGETYKIDFAMDIAKRATEFYIKYYEVAYPLPKLDLIAIPDYVSGATEHWGLVTFRETALLLAPAAAAARARLAVAGTVAHELAHMWFGNLVTNKWWDDLWLNEGFATYMQVKCLDAIEPSWGVMERFPAQTLQPVLAFDAARASRPVLQAVAAPDEITAVFDAISYNKGASLLRMLEGAAGAEAFRRGVRAFLAAHRFASAETRDLLASLRPHFHATHPGLDLDHIMDTWTRQMGYPLVSVAPGAEPGTFVLTQRRFLNDPDAKYDENESPFKYRWFIPITYKTARGAADEVIWFSDKEESVTIKLSGPEDWLKVNNDQVGYYRVTYTAEMWARLAELMQSQSPQLSAADRAQLVSDSLSLAAAGALPYAAALRACAALRAERGGAVWAAARAPARQLADRMGGGDFDKFMQYLIKPLYEELMEQKNDSLSHSLQKTETLGLAAQHGLPEALAHVRALFVAWLDDGAPVPPELRDVVYYYGTKTASAAQWERVWEEYTRASDVQEAGRLRRALAATADPALLDKLLELAWDESKVRSQDHLSLLGAAAAAGAAGAARAWRHVRASWPRLVARYSLNSRYLGGLIPEVTGRFATEERLKEMEEFFGQHPAAGAGAAARRRAMEAVRGNVAWAAAHRAAVAAWLRDFICEHDL